MDNTDVKRHVVLVRKTHTPETNNKVNKGRTVGYILTAKALPFKFAIVTLLQRQGISTIGLNFKTLLVKFYNIFSGRKPIDESAFINNVAFKLKTTDKPNGDVESARNQTAYMQVVELTNAVIDTFKTAKDKYNVCLSSGLQPEQQLTDSDLTMAKASFKVQRDLLKESKKDHYVSSGELRNTIYWLIGIGLVIWFLNSL